MARPLPMFPLGTVLFPFADLPLHVFEPRYRVMVHDLLAGDRAFGVVLIERGHEVGGGDTRFSIGTVASLVRAGELPDGRWALLAVGVERIRVEEWLPDDPYPRAYVTELGEAPSTERATDARDRVVDALDALLTVVAPPGGGAVRPEIHLSADPVRASYEAAALAPLGPLDAQRVLELDAAADRLDVLARLLTEHTEVLRRVGGDRGA